MFNEIRIDNGIDVSTLPPTVRFLGGPSRLAEHRLRMGPATAKRPRSWNQVQLLMSYWMTASFQPTAR
jgi:hypothetical protein